MSAHGSRAPHLVPDVAARFVCERFWSYEDYQEVKSAIAEAKPANTYEGILAGIRWIYRPRSPLSRPMDPSERLAPVLNKLPPDTRDFFRGAIDLPPAEAVKHRSRIRRFLMGVRPHSAGK